MELEENTLILAVVLMPMPEPVGGADVNLHIPHPSDAVDFDDRLLEIGTGILMGGAGVHQPQSAVVGRMQIQHCKQLITPKIVQQHLVHSILSYLLVNSLQNYNIFIK